MSEAPGPPGGALRPAGPGALLVGPGSGGASDAQGAGFGELLRALRTARGISQAAVAAGAGLDRSYINRIEAGERGAPAGPAVEALIGALRLSPAEADRLTASAGLLPRALRVLGPDDPTVLLLAGRLADPALTPTARAALRSTVELLVHHWGNPGNPAAPQPGNPGTPRTRAAPGARRPLVGPRGHPRLQGPRDSAMSEGLSIRPQTLHLSPRYRRLRDSILRPHLRLTESRYFWERWKARLGPDATVLIMEVRDRCNRALSPALRYHARHAGV